MVTQAEAREILIIEASIDTDDFDNTTIERWLEYARVQHDQDIAWGDDITASNGHLEGIILLASITHAYVLLRHVAKKDALRGGGAETDGYKRYEALKALIESLREQYDELTDRLGIGEGGDSAAGIVVRQLSRWDPITETTVPWDNQPAPPKVRLAVTTPASGVARLVWNEVDMLDFYRYRVYQHTSSGIVDKSLLENDEHTGYDGIIEDATKLRDIEDKDHVEYKSTGLTPGSTYYYVVVVEDISGKRSYSDEESVTVS